MSFNFGKNKENAKQLLNSKTVGAIVLGPGGAGKSAACGTFPGKVLYLITGGEQHGATSASTYASGEIVPIRIDMDDEGNKIGADATYARLLQILGDVEGIKAEGFTAVVLDSLTELENVVRSTTKFSRDCESSNGKRNKFAEPSVTIEMIRPVLVALQDLAAEGIHYAATCPLTVQAVGDDGQITEASPRLSGYSVAENVVLQFPDVLVVGRVDVKGKMVHAFQFLAGVSKVSKDQAGQIKKLINFSPRVTGVKTLPELLPANFSKVIELKAKGGVNEQGK